MLEGKLGLIFGVANKRSIAWAIAQALSAAGVRLAFTYQERVADTVRELAATVPDSLTFECNVQDDSQVDAVFDAVSREFGGLDILIHSIAFAPREALEGKYLNTTREAFLTALDVSAYSLTHLARKAAPLMEARGGGSIVTMTYLGSDRVFPSYNVMGVAKAALESSVRYLAYDLGEKNIRVNAISAGPISTLSARGIRGFSQMRSQVSEVTPLRRGTEAAEVADVATFLCSPAARGITGDVIFVDSGYHVLGMFDRLEG